MKNISNQTDDSIAKKVHFLCVNYLNKVAPIVQDPIRNTSWKFFESQYQVSPYSDCFYHRLFRDKHLKASESFNKNLALENKSPLILTDTDQITKLLKLKFQVIENDDPSLIFNSLKKHFEKFDSVKTALKNNLDLSFILDTTAHLNQIIETKQDQQLENNFAIEFEKYKTTFSQMMDRSIDQLLQDDLLKDKITKKDLKTFIEKNSTCICRVCLDASEKIYGIKVLPLFSDIQPNQLAKKHKVFTDFIEESGLVMGAINMRRAVPSLYPIPQEIEYTGESHHTDTLYFKSKEEFINCSSIKRLFQRLDDKEFANTKPHFTVLGMATLSLLEGLFSEITEDKWNELNDHPATREILQIILYKIRAHLADAELSLHNYNQFAQLIELVHAEIASLLELTQPFKTDQFSQIFAEQLDVIPENLKSHLKTGLGKTAVTMFVGINVALFAHVPRPIRAYSEGFYYEQVNLLGENNKLETLLEDPSISSIDLYAGAFNPNLQYRSDNSEYQHRDIASDIEQIFVKKPQTQHLTAVIDLTIDRNSNNNVKDLLTKFEKEIKEGKINFVFFRSGQKYDMFGMDNYYGTPFYLVNNGDKQWESYNDLFTEPVYQTDTLSHQWFCLAQRYASEYLEKYKELIFANNREVLTSIPTIYRASKENKRNFTVCSIDDKMDPSFIDVKIQGLFHFVKACLSVSYFFQFCEAQKVKALIRGSFGFFHPSTTLIYGKECTHLRLHAGLSPEENIPMLQFLHNLL